MPPHVPKHKNTVMYLVEKFGVMGKFHSGVSCRAVGCEFYVNELAISIK